MAFIGYVPLLSAIVSISATSYLVWLYNSRKKIYYLLFAAMMFDMFIGQILEFYAEAIGWTPGLYKLYYYTSPISPVLGALGVVALLGRKKALLVLGLYTLVVSIILAYRVATAEINTEALELGPYVGGEAMAREARILSPLLTTPGGLVLIIGSILAYRGDKKVAYLAILLGALVFMIAGGLLRKGYGEVFLVLELVGTILLAYAFSKT